jgi:hypothetical protein
MTKLTTSIKLSLSIFSDMRTRRRASRRFASVNRLAVLALLSPVLGVGIAQAGVISDPAGDTKARDLDIRTVDVSLNKSSLRAKIILARSSRDNSIYSVFVVCGKSGWQLGAKRAAGDTTIFLFSFGSYKQVDVPGSIAGRTITFDAPADKMGCKKGDAKFYVTAEGTNGRAQMTDRLPKKGYVKL